MPDTPQQSVLVVDDNAATLYATARVLRSAGLLVYEAATGHEALVQALRLPNLIVLDINLPDIDGFEVCRALRARRETRQIPIIYLSATFVDDIDKVHAVNAGADGYLTHPVEPPVLIATVQAFLRARRAEDAIEESEGKFKAVFDNALNGIALLSGDLLFLDVNAAMCQLLGRSREAIVGRHISAFSPKEQQFGNREIVEALALSSAWRGPLPVLNAEGALIDLEWSISVHSLPDIRLAIVNDLTERKAIDAERERLLISERLARTEAERANRSKDDFLAALSHELRTPLNAILGFSRLLRLRPLASDPPTLSNIEAIERNARVQAKLISDLLDITRIASGKLQLERQRFNVAESVQSAVDSIQGAAKAKNITIDTDLDRAAGDISWDPARFQQVVWNLIENAVKFSPTAACVHVRLVRRPLHIELQVRDHGHGIAPEFLPHVFDRFRQEHAGSRRSHGGLGLGLAIVHQIVSAHGDTIDVASEGRGQGAAFTLRVRRALTSQGDVTVQAAPGRRAANLEDVRVLLVEDNDDARALVRAALVDASATVLDVADAESALMALDTFHPDLLVSDVGMPDQDGYDLIRRVRQAGWSAERLPAIAVTAFAGEEDRSQVLNAGFQSHCPKPLDVGTFLAEVSRLVADN
jgi:PAS domain S-box-containing protein